MDWRLIYPGAEVYALPPIGSYHSPLLLSTVQVHKNRQRTFAYEAFWNDDPEVYCLVSQTWPSNQSKNSDLLHKLSRVRIALSQWSRSKFGNGHLRITALQQRLQTLFNHPYCSNIDSEEVSHIQNELRTIWKQEEQFWAMRSRINWLRWGDKNSKFFHATTIQRRQRNRIGMLRKADNEWVRDIVALKELTSAYFTQLYTSAGHREFGPVLDQCSSVVTDTMNAQLLASVTVEEVRQATFQLGATKAPGPDGFNGLFYQTHWTTIQHDLLCLVNDFFHYGKFPPDLNKTLLVLIPKVHHPKSLNQFRPISLCNFAYKVISKVMANRLRPLLEQLVSSEQTAFVSGRQIQDNVFVVHEVLHQFKTRHRKRHFQAILKTDMHKAYDKVEWDFLQAYLIKLGFHPWWVQMVMYCITTTTMSVKLNRESLPYFKPSKGLRQGDPLSPYLFILMANALSTLIHNALMMGHLRGIKLTRSCPTLSHLLFADDSVFFLNGTIIECQNMANILNQYCHASGQVINHNKSGLYFSKGCPPNLQTNLAAELRVPVLSGYGKYLGVPSEWGGSKKELFGWLLGRVHAKLEGWKEMLLSKGGKEILLKSVIQAMPQYAMSIFKLPLSLCRIIERRIANFWWRNYKNRNGVHWKKLDLLMTGKTSGGLGFRDLAAFNNAMLGKQAWRLLHQPQSLWGRVQKGLYFPSKDFEFAESGSRPSWGWRSILIGWDAILPNARWSIGDGKSINIREHCWLPRGKIGGPANRDEPRLVADLIDPLHHTWKTHLITQMFDDSIVDEILNIPLRPLHSTDQIIWTATTTGQYTVKSNYRTLTAPTNISRGNLASTSYHPPPELWRYIWKMHSTPKLRIFLWSACQNALATKSNLYSRHIISTPVCTICNQNVPETVEHIFFYCPWTAGVWSHPQL